MEQQVDVSLSFTLSLSNQSIIFFKVEPFKLFLMRFQIVSSPSAPPHEYYIVTYILPLTHPSSDLYHVPKMYLFIQKNKHSESPLQK